MTTAVATQQESPVIALFQKSAKQITAAIPKGAITPERFMRIALTEMRKNPDLLKCKPVSVIQALMQAAQLGLEPGFGGKAYLIPYKDECTFQPGYRGLLELARRSKEISAIYTKAVYDGDDFQETYGSKLALYHKPMHKSTNATYYYAFAKLKDGAEQFEVMARSQVEEHRKRYSKSKYNSPWDTEFDEMARKTVLKRLLKMLPCSTEVADAIAYEDEVLDNQREIIMTAENIPSDADHKVALDKLARQVSDAKQMGIDLADLNITKTVEGADTRTLLALCDAIETRIADKH